jgi:nucleotide-binding universal stress UspA family protein
MIDLRRILVPIDFSKYSQNALTYAVALAEKFDAELYLLHVVQNLAVFFPDILAVSAPSTEELNQSVRRALDRVIQESRMGNLKVHTEVRQGTPFYEIINYAQENTIDLIVMGTHGRTGLVHVLMGSVTEKVVRKSPCPVLTVRHPEHEFVHPSSNSGGQV